MWLCMRAQSEISSKAEVNHVTTAIQTAIVTDKLKICGHAKNLQPPQMAVLRHQKSQMFLVEALHKDSYSAEN